MQLLPIGGSMPSPSPNSELPPPANLSRFTAWHDAMVWVVWVSPFGLHGSPSFQLFLFHVKISFQKDLDYFFLFFKNFCCVAPQSDVNQVFWMFILFHCSLDQSMGDSRAMFPPLGLLITGIMPFWVLEAPSPEAFYAKYTQSLGQSL